MLENFEQYYFDKNMRTQIKKFGGIVSTKKVCKQKHSKIYGMGLLRRESKSLHSRYFLTK